MKLAPLFLSISHYEFNGTQPCGHVLRIIYFSLNHSFCYYSISTFIGSASLFIQLYQVIPFNKIIFKRLSFFLTIFVSFVVITRFSMGLCKTPGFHFKHSFEHSLVCLNNLLMFLWIQSNLYLHSSYLCSTGQKSF